MSSKRKAGQGKAGNRPASPATSPSSSSESSKASSPTDSSAAGPNKSQIDFQFLNFSHPSEAKASGARKAVRSHVTKEYHKREQAAAALRRAQTSPLIGGDAGDTSTPSSTTTISTGRLGLVELPHRPPPTGSSVQSSSSSSSTTPSSASPYRSDRQLEPGQIYPDAWRPYVPRIMDHYLTNMAVDIPDLDGPEARGLLRSRFFPFILTDAAPLHAVMLMAASHYGTTRGSRSHTINLLQLRGMAIREINSALEDPRRATSDQLIAAVAKMAAYEAIFGDRQIFNTHMTGLLRMVSLRGGLPALGLDGLLERILLWIDSNAAHITGSHIYFDKAAFPSSSRHPRPDPQRFAGGLARSP